MKKMISFIAVLTVVAVFSGCGKASPVAADLSSSKTTSYSSGLSYADWLAALEFATGLNESQLNAEYLTETGMTLRQWYNTYINATGPVTITVTTTQCGCDNSGGSGGSVSTVGKTDTSTIAKVTVTTIANNRSSTVGRN